MFWEDCICPDQFSGKPIHEYEDNDGSVDGCLCESIFFLLAIFFSQIVTSSSGDRFLNKKFYTEVLQ